MNIALWVLQVLLGLAFVFHSYLMLRPSPERLQSGMKYVLEMPRALRLFAGVAEGLAALALILPALFNILVWITPLAAAGLVLLMLGAIVFHIPRHEYQTIGLNVVLGLLAAFVAWGRFGPYHF
jgi:VIT1/CCC1 family predicted Fe2+/Mn2+ transporter